MAYTDEDGWTYSAHPLPPEGDKLEFLRGLEDLYKDREVKDILSYYNSNYDPLTCPANWLWNASLRPEPTWGFEVIWKVR